MELKHPDEDVAAAFTRLQDALTRWERATGRESLLIFRESAGSFGMSCPQPTEVLIRLDNGVSIDPANLDVPDAHLLERFKA